MTSDFMKDIIDDMGLKITDDQLKEIVDE